ncbi:MAG: hypothetical protein E2590_06905 [Chryseobacterium sp.]|nr:hypothetical protein [Chryseobacterium sp.]
MKKKLSIISLVLSGALFSQNVGINTDAPTEALDVNGSVAIGTSVFVDPNNYTANPQGFDILGTDPQSSIVNGKIFKVETLYTPIIIQPYSVSNIYRDDLNDLNLQIPSDKYTVLITNFEAVPSTSNINEPNNGVYSNTNMKGRFVIRTFESGGNWHVNIGYPSLDTQYTSARYTYNFDVILLSKRFYKVLDESVTTYNLNGATSGEAAAPPSGI